MCLIIKGKGPRIAKRDIYCLKIVNDYNPETGLCKSFFHESPQRVGYTMRSKMKEITGTAEKGIHAMRIGRILATFKKGTYSTVMLAKIPKGSNYYIGCYGDIVSDRMVLVEPLVSNTNSEDLELALENTGGRVFHFLSVSELFKIANQIVAIEGYKNHDSNDYYDPNVSLNDYIGKLGLKISN